MIIEININFSNQILDIEANSVSEINIDFKTTQVRVSAVGALQFGGSTQSGGGEWGYITGDIENQTDLIDYIENNSGGIESVTGDIVDNTDPANPIVNTPTFNEVLAEDNETDGQDISISDGDQIQFDNYSRIRKGATDAGLGGQKGVALVCSIDYELKWEAGRQYIMQQDGFTIREVSHNFSVTPTVNDDDTKGFVQDSRWILDDGTVYVCSDATTGAAVWAAIIDGTVTSVGLTMPSAFTVSNSPITSSGDIAVTGAGLVSQYVRGDGTLANFPASTGGGASQSFYLNGSVSQGTFGGIAFKEMDRVPILGAGTDFTINTNGYIQSFITDANVPNQLQIPAGNWNFETYFSASSNGGNPSFYVELYKWDGATLSLIASSSANPEGITNGTAIDLYLTALAVPQTALLATDRLAVRIYVNNSGRTIKLHTENNHLSQIITTFSTGITALNGLTDQVQNLAVGTSGTDFAISSISPTHTFNLPTASASNRGALSSTDWTTFNNKVGGSGTSGQIAYWNGTATQTGSADFTWDNTNKYLVSNIGLSGYVKLEQTGWNNGFIQTAFSNFIFGSNLRYNGTQWIYDKSGFGAQFQADTVNGYIQLNTSTSGTAGTTAIIRTRLRILNDGRTLLGTSIVTDDTTSSLQVGGSGRFTGTLKIDTINGATTDTDKFLVSDNGIIKFRTGAETLLDIGAITSVSAGTNISITGTATSPIINKLNSERRNDWVAPYSYCGSAPNGSAESASVWTIYRIQVASDGTVTTLSATNVKWTDRLIVIYT